MKSVLKRIIAMVSGIAMLTVCAQAGEISAVTDDDAWLTATYLISRPFAPVEGSVLATICGEDVYQVGFDEDATSYVLLAPDETEYLYQRANNYLGKVVFAGWIVGDDDTDVLQPGDSLDLTGYGEGENVVLTAKWDVMFADNTTAGKYGSMVNFFIAISGHPDEDPNWTGDATSGATWTTSVYTDSIGVNASDATSKELYVSQSGSGAWAEYNVLGDSQAQNVMANHNAITNLLTQGYTMQGSDGLDYTFQTTFPSDEMALIRVRQKMGTSLRINGRTVSASDMTPENFSVRWMVVKASNSDGWHIDGVLVSRTGSMKVRKTFAGNQTLIQEVKENFSIDVVGQNNPPLSGGHLTVANYDSYDAATDTYEWTVPVNPYYDYVVGENNHLPVEAGAMTHATYEVCNAKTLSQNTSDWVDYDYEDGEGFEVTGQVEGDNPLTVNFRNWYSLSRVLYTIARPFGPVMEYEFATIMGGDTYIPEVLKSDTSHTILTPNVLTYLYSHTGKYLGRITFKGWMVNGDENDILYPGDELIFADYPPGELITLTATWDILYADNNTGKDGPMINFYVALSGHPDEDYSWEGSVEAAKFTTSVYTDNVGVPAGDIPEKELYAWRSDKSPYQYFLLGDTSGENCVNNHNIITNSLMQGYTLLGNDGTNYTFKTTFPSDEQVVYYIRDMIRKGTEIDVKGHIVTEDEMTAENFTVRWYVFKADSSDGWHIDGVLVSRLGSMIVRKTFKGVEELVEGVKENYSIDVVGQDDPPHAGGHLTLENYDSYNPDTDTYEWSVAIDQYHDYIVRENHYESTVPLTRSIAEYEVCYSKTIEQNTHGWTPYTFDSTNGVHVTGQSDYKRPNKLTVNMLNTYTYRQPGTLVIKKIDANTGRSMHGINFRLYDAEGNPFNLFNHRHSFYTMRQKPGETIMDTTNLLTTDAAGMMYLTLDGGTYQLIEDRPIGYEDIGPIWINLVWDPTVDYVMIESVATDDPKYISYEPDGMEINVYNYARTGDLVVEKIWANGENKSVTLQLFNGDEAYRAPFVLDGVVDEIETEPWKATLRDVPAFVHGELAQYNVREERIGDFWYSSQSVGGYQFYNVTYSELETYDIHGQLTTDLNAVHSAKLTVTNDRNRTPLTIIANSALKVYDGTPLVDPGYTVDIVMLCPGDEVEAVVEGTLTDVGTCQNTITSYRVMRDGEDVTSWYSEISVVHGSLEVIPRPVVITAGSATKDYDGEPLTDSSFTIKDPTEDTGFVTGETAISATMTPASTITDPGQVPNVIQSIQLSSGVKPINYAFTFLEGTLAVQGVNPRDPLIAEFTLSEDNSKLETMRVYLLGMIPGDILYFLGAQTFEDACAGNWHPINNSTVPYEELDIGEDNISPCRDIHLPVAAHYRFFQPCIYTPSGRIWHGRKFVGVTDVPMDRYGETSAGVHFVECLSEAGDLPGVGIVKPDISPRYLVQTNTLISGSALKSDKLYLLRDDENFDVYTLGADREWAGVQNEKGTKPSIEDVFLPRGMGIVVVRMPQGAQDVEGIVRLHGQVSEEPLPLEVPECGIIQVACTIPGPLDLNDKVYGLVGEDGDMIVYMDEFDTQHDIFYGNPDGAGMRWYTELTKIVRGKRSVELADPMWIPTGRVFWYSTEARIFPDAVDRH